MRGRRPDGTVRRRSGNGSGGLTLPADRRPPVPSRSTWTASAGTPGTAPCRRFRDPSRGSVVWSSAWPGSLCCWKSSAPQRCSAGTTASSSKPYCSTPSCSRTGRGTPLRCRGRLPGTWLPLAGPMDFGDFYGGDVRRHDTMRSRHISGTRGPMCASGIAVVLPHREPQIVHVSYWNTNHSLMEAA